MLATISDTINVSWVVLDMQIPTIKMEATVELESLHFPQFPFGNNI